MTRAGGGLSTHVLDTGRGLPAPGVPVTVFRQEGDELRAVGAGVTDDDGRVADLLAPDGDLEPGWYRIVFDLAPYYGSQRHFFGRVTLDFAVAEARHHHVPLLVSPFGATSYRGS
jgi:5-hydroxyisourate hydrolase